MPHADAGRPAVLCATVTVPLTPPSLLLRTPPPVSLISPTRRAAAAAAAAAAAHRAPASRRPSTRRRLRRPCRARPRGSEAPPRLGAWALGIESAPGLCNIFATLVNYYHTLRVLTKENQSGVVRKFPPMIAFTACSSREPPQNLQGCCAGRFHAASGCVQRETAPKNVGEHSFWPTSAIVRVLAERDRGRRCLVTRNSSLQRNRLRIFRGATRTSMGGGILRRARRPAFGQLGGTASAKRRAHAAAAAGATQRHHSSRRQLPGVERLGPSRARAGTLGLGLGRTLTRV